MYSQDWNVTVERQLAASLGLQVAYVGMKATHLQMTGNFNQPFVTNGFYDSTRPYTTLPLTSPVLPAQCAPPNAPCSIGNVTRIFSPGNSNYNALWVTLNKHLSNGLEFLAAYTYSHSWTTARSVLATQFRCRMFTTRAAITARRNSIRAIASSSAVSTSCRSRATGWFPDGSWGLSPWPRAAIRLRRSWLSVRRRALR